MKLREKFLQQEYPLNLIYEQFARAFLVDRADLLLADPSMRKKARRRIVVQLIVTHSPENTNTRNGLRKNWPSFKETKK